MQNLWTFINIFPIIFYLTTNKLLNGDNFILFLRNIYNPREINTN